jgi:hypothetical protein
MSFEVHTIEEPQWLRALVQDVLVDAVQPLGFIGPLGYRWWEPNNTENNFDGWQVAVYPTPNEVIGPTAFDGCKYVSGFRLNVWHILNCLTAVEGVAWHAPVQYNGYLDGPEISVRGMFAGKHVWIRFFQLPPPDEPASFLVNPATGQAIEKSA